MAAYRNFQSQTRQSIVGPVHDRLLTYSFQAIFALGFFAVFDPAPATGMHLHAVF